MERSDFSVLGVVVWVVVVGFIGETVERTIKSLFNGETESTGEPVERTVKSLFNGETESTGESLRSMVLVSHSR